MLEFITSADFYILDFIHNHLQCGFLNSVMPFVTSLGDIGLVWIVLTLILMIFKKYRKTAVKMAVALILTVIICNLLIKPLVMRTRPYDVNTAVQLLISAPMDFSFPSSHTAASFAAAWALFTDRKKLGTAALILAFLIAFSRLYLYVHYPSDVLAGAVIGIALAVLAGIITEFLYKRKRVK